MKSATVLLVMLCSTLVWAKEPATTQAISNTRYARRVLTVSTSGDYSPDFNDLLAFLNGKARELGPTMLNIPADKMDQTFSVGTNMTAASIELDMTAIEADQPNARPAAKEFLNSVVTAAQSYVMESFHQRRDRDVMLAQRDRDVCDAQVREATENAHIVRSKLSDLAGRADVSVAGLTAAVSRLEEEKEKLELDVLGKKARQEALEKEIAKLSDELQTAARNDPVAQELAKVVEVRQVKLDQVRKMHDAGTTTDAEIQDAIAALAEARAKLVERQRAGGDGAGGAETLAALSRERVNLSIDLRELQVRLEYAEKHLPPLRSAMDRLDELQRAEGVLKGAQDALASSTNHYNELRRHLETLDPPQVLLKVATDRETAVLPPGEQ